MSQSQFVILVSGMAIFVSVITEELSIGGGIIGAALLLFVWNLDKKM